MSTNIAQPPTGEGASLLRNDTKSVFESLKPPFNEKRAKVEALRCLECGGPYAEAPCVTACPTNIDVPGFIDAIAEGQPNEAADIIFNENILGGSCARVCPVENLCEGACVLLAEGRKPIEIGRLQQYATDFKLNNQLPFKSPVPSNGMKVSVIGAGPAGLSCASQLALIGYNVTVYDSHEDFGGLVRYAIAPYRLYRDPIPDEIRLIQALGVKFQMGHEIDSREKLKYIEDQSDAVFLGIGLGKDVDMEIPGDELKGIWNSLDFIQAIKTDRIPQIGKRVAVIGGGNTAIDVAREALRLGARDVTLYYRRTESEMPAYKHEVEEAREEGVHFQFLTTPVQFEGRQQVEKMVCQYMKLGAKDKSGRPRPEKVPDTEFAVPVDTVIKAIGQQKRTSFLDWIEGIDLEKGLITIDPETGQTSHPKYFAGGDAINGGATVVEAVQDGKIAAHGIHKKMEVHYDQ